MQAGAVGFGNGGSTSANLSLAMTASAPETLDASAQVSLAASADLAHQTDFLRADCLTHTYAGLSQSRRQNCLKQMKARDYTHIYVYPYNERDYGGPSFDFYKNPQGFLNILKEIKRAGLLPVVWLNPDDAPLNKARSVTEHKARLDALIPVIDGDVSSYVLGLEMNEYWSFSTADSLGKHLSGLTRKKIAVHQTPGRWDYCQKASWCDYMVLQYGFGKTESAIAEMTRKALSALRRPVVAGEYNIKTEDHGQRLGDAAMQAGAVGFGNGGSTTAMPPSDAVAPHSPAQLQLVN
jgi:hypothetical protein